MKKEISRKTGCCCTAFPLFKKYKAILLLDLFCASLTTACDLTLPLIVRKITK
jgi:ATP-binding cassette subfamily B protein